MNEFLNTFGSLILLFDPSARRDGWRGGDGHAGPAAVPARVRAAAGPGGGGLPARGAADDARPVRWGPRHSTAAAAAAAVKLVEESSTSVSENSLLAVVRKIFRNDRDYFMRSP